MASPGPKAAKAALGEIFGLRRWGLGRPGLGQVSEAVQAVGQGVGAAVQSVT